MWYWDYFSIWHFFLTDFLHSPTLENVPASPTSSSLPKSTSDIFPLLISSRTSMAVYSAHGIFSTYYQLILLFWCTVFIVIRSFISTGELSSIWTANGQQYLKKSCVKTHRNMWYYNLIHTLHISILYQIYEILAKISINVEKNFIIILYFGVWG